MTADQDRKPSGRPLPAPAHLSCPVTCVAFILPKLLFFLNFLFICQLQLTYNLTRFGVQHSGDTFIHLTEVPVE